MAHRQQGFVLAVTLWVLAIIALGVGYFAHRVQQSLALAQQTRQSADAALEMANTRAEMLFRLGTTHLSAFGVGLSKETAVALDDRPYQGSGSDRIRLQDEGGLLNVNFVRADVWSRMLAQMGIPEHERAPMLDALADYTDTDDLRRLSGAEAAEYSAQGLPPPPNDWLVTPRQLENVIGWRDKPQLWEQGRLLKLLTSARIAGLNLNSAPLEVLEMVAGSPDAAKALVERRELEPFGSVGPITAILGMALDDEYYRVLPSLSVRITQYHPALPRAEQLSVTLTPHSEQAPWRINYHLQITAPSDEAHATEIKPLPAWSATRRNPWEAL